GRRLPVEPAWRGRPEQLGRLSDPGYLRSAQRRAATIDGRLIGLQRLRSNEKRHVPQQRTWRFFFGEPITGGQNAPGSLAILSRRRSRRPPPWHAPRNPG